MWIACIQPRASLPGLEPPLSGFRLMAGIIWFRMNEHPRHATFCVHAQTGIVLFETLFKVLGRTDVALSQLLAPEDIDMEHHELPVVRI